MSRVAVLGGFLTAGIDWFVPSHVRAGNAELLRRARLVVLCAWALLLAAAAFAAVFVSMGSPNSVVAVIIGASAAVACLFLIRRTGSCLIVGNLLTTAFFGTLAYLATRQSGHNAQALVWYAAVPVVALSTAGRGSATVWFAVVAATLSAFYLMCLSGCAIPMDFSTDQFELLRLISSIGLMLLVLGLALAYETAVSRTWADLKCAEERLRREKDFSDYAIASLPGVFYLLDEQGRILRWNENFERLSGYSAAEVPRMNALDFFRGDDKVVIRQAINEVFTNGQTLVEASYVTKHGTAIPYLFTGKRAIIDGKIHVIGMGIDITERKRIETELAVARDSAEAATRSKSHFLANMSHEIRTPMTAILGFSEVLLGEPDIDRAPPERIEAIRTIQRNGRCLLELINDILDLSKIEAGKLDIERITFSPMQVLSDVISLMRVRADAKNLPLTAGYVGGIPESIQGDPLRLRQILINLVGNAIKFTEKGSVEVVARLLQRIDKPALLQFDVIDTGIGLSQQQVGKLFTPFNQADSSTTRKFGGTGLGLTISKRLAEMLGGDITISSMPGKGSTFGVTIVTGDLEGVKLLETPQEAIVSAPSASSDRSTAAAVRLDHCRILLAEDGPDNQRLIAFLLKKAGAEVTLAENGQLAIEHVSAAWKQGQPFNVILMDMQMPVMDGYTATRQLRGQGYTGPIVALTAHAMVEDRAKCLEAGCDDFASKPIERQRLLDVVARWAACNACVNRVPVVDP